MRGDAHRYTPYLAAKLIADPLRILLWIAHHRADPDRRRVLDSAVRFAPEHEEGARLAIDLLDGLAHSQPGAIDRALPHLAHISEHLAARFAADAEEAGFTTVRLEGATDPLPLCDWTALVAPPRAVETVHLRPGDPGTAADVRSALTHARAGRYPILARGRLLVAATPERWPDGALRALNCPESDPVSFALLNGSRERAFHGCAAGARTTWRSGPARAGAPRA